MTIYSNPLSLHLGKLGAQWVLSKLAVEVGLGHCVSKISHLTRLFNHWPSQFCSEEHRVQILNNKEIRHLPLRGVLLVHTISASLLPQRSQGQNCEHVSHGEWCFREHVFLWSGRQQPSRVPESLHRAAESSCDKVWPRAVLLVPF